MGDPVNTACALAASDLPRHPPARLGWGSGGVGGGGLAGNLLEKCGIASNPFGNGQNLSIIAIHRSWLVLRGFLGGQAQLLVNGSARPWGGYHFTGHYSGPL